MCMDMEGTFPRGIEAAGINFSSVQLSSPMIRCTCKQERQSLQKERKYYEQSNCRDKCGENVRAEWI